MSIEIGSTVSEELAEVAERFYTPGSSTEVSQPIAESFQTPKSHMSFNTPSSDSPGGFMTPQEYPFSPVEHKRPSTGVQGIPPAFLKPLIRKRVFENDSLTFYAEVFGLPSPEVKWFCEKKIPHNNKKYLHSSDGDNHFLKICKVTTQDSGVYTCRAINVVGETLCRACLVVLNAKAFSGKTRDKKRDDQ
uniref:Ig-like domain-containing protein n=1 Tax=Sander lucioperca TaxID=283035 RepID=A0A8D0D3S9_SANLU